MATKQELDEQQALREQQLAQKNKQLQDAYNLSQSQLEQQKKEKETSSAKLAQQAYISKKQTERVMPDVLAAQGLAQTGYVNTRKNQITQGYEGQYGAIQDDLQSARAAFSRQDASEDLAFQQQSAALDLERQAAALDYRQALNSLSSRSSGRGTGTQSNVQLINTALSKAIKDGSLDTNSAAMAAKNYYDGGYLDKKDYYNTVRGAKQLANAVAQINAKKSTPKTKKGR